MEKLDLFKRQQVEEKRIIFDQTLDSDLAWENTHGGTDGWDACVELVDKNCSKCNPPTFSCKWRVFYCQDKDGTSQIFRKRKDEA